MLTLLSGPKAQVRLRQRHTCFSLYLIFFTRLHKKIVFKTNFYMRTFTLLCTALVLGTTALKAQTIATFEALTLPHADTFYVNYSASGSDVGFDNGLAHFPCVYDTSWGGFWSSGFSYSDMTDSTTTGYTNMYSSRTGIGYGASSQYVVSYGVTNTVKLNGAAAGAPVNGFYVTNSTYAYYSMKDGDAFARKFHNGDWFKLTVRAYRGGMVQPDSVGVYLADFLFADSTHNYILKDWQWVDLMPLGHADSLQFILSSTDNGSFGMNTPAYFCMDNFTTDESSLGVPDQHTAAAAKVYPNPANDKLYVDLTDNNVDHITVMDATGKIVSTTAVIGQHVELNISSLAAGTYIIQMAAGDKTATARFTRQ